MFSNPKMKTFKNTASSFVLPQYFLQLRIQPQSKQSPVFIDALHACPVYMDGPVICIFRHVSMDWDYFWKSAETLVWAEIVENILVWTYVFRQAVKQILVAVSGTNWMDRCNLKFTLNTPLVSFLHIGVNIVTHVKCQVRYWTTAERVKHGYSCS